MHIEKLCTKCHQSFTLDRFSIRRTKLKSGAVKERLVAECKKCENKRKYKQRKTNPVVYEKIKERARKRSVRRIQQNPDREKARLKKYIEDYKNSGKSSDDHRFRKYGITGEQYREMLKNQQECCKICKRHKSEFKRPLHIDHCHTTGKVRGILCTNCNSVLGYAKDNVETLQGAIKYLRLAS